MEQTQNKNIKNFILDPTYDLNELFDYLESPDSFNSTIEGITSALYKLLIRNYDQNKSRSDYLIKILETIVNDTNFTDAKAKYLSGCLINLNNNLYSNIKKKQLITIRESLTRLSELHNNISNRLINQIKNSKLKLLEYFIFQERNLYFVEQCLKSDDNVLNYHNSENDDIFSLILKKYLYLNENNKEEIEYFYNIILLFIESKFGSYIIKNKAIYQRIIKQAKVDYKEHIIKVIELFDPNFKIEPEELENRFNIRFEFPNVIFHEMNTFVMDNDGRVNFTHQPAITIDGKNDICLDDALYIEENKDGSHYLYIYIADIPSFVPYNSSIDIEAKRRLESLYLKGLIIPVYPEQICDNLCSLLPNNNRNVIAYRYLLDSNCELVDERPEIIKAKIRVSHKLSYDEVDKIMNSLTNNELDINLSKLFLFSINQRKANPDKELYRKLENFIKSEDHHESLKLDKSSSASIIHECMVANNHGIAEVFKTLDLPYAYREFLVPSDGYIEEQYAKILNLGEKVVNKQTFINNLLTSYSRGIYTIKPTYHNGLKLSSYSHSSSPLRRYADAHNQYLVHDFIFDEKSDDLNIHKWAYRTEELIRYANQKKDDNENFSRYYNYLAHKKLIKSKK